MATASSNMKAFYRQRKNNKSGITKSSSKTTSKSKKKSSCVTQPTALDSHGDYDKNEELLRQFDMSMVYGPCLGMSRLERWERAQRLGLNPPKEIEGLLKSENVQSECLWDGRV